jgi:Outer membrane protein beta-barrel domain
MSRKASVAGLLVTALLGVPVAAHADSLFGFHAGGFFLRGEDGRTDGDVLVENLSFRTLIDADFDEPLKVFNGGTISGEYLYGIGDFIEAGVGIGYYQKDEASYYTDFEEVDGTDIIQDTKIRLIPVTVSVRAFPIGRTTPVQPYVGAGVNFYRWRYSETGEFIDFSQEDLPVFRDSFVDDGSAVGGIFLAGVRAPIGDRFLIGGEFRWQNGKADLDPALNFAGDKLDLGGYSVVGGFHVRF